MNTELTKKLNALQRAIEGERRNMDGFHVTKTDKLFAECIKLAGEQTEGGPVALTDYQYNILKERMIEEHRKYGDKLRSGHWAEIAARKVVGHLRDMRLIAPAHPPKPSGLSDEDAQLMAVRLFPVHGPRDLQRDHLIMQSGAIRTIEYLRNNGYLSSGLKVDKAAWDAALSPDK